MRILHYFLGPLRQGGLNRYVRDLAISQSEMGNQVMFLYPVGSIFPPARPIIKKAKFYRGIECFQLSGGLPISLLEGIKNPDMILKNPRKLGKTQCSDFFQTTHPDILHIHTWMGFPAELLTEFKLHGTRIIFTTHDYYGLCPKVNFIHGREKLCTVPTNLQCSQCNASAPSEHFLAVRNSNTLMRLKSIIQPLLKIRQILQPQKKNPACQTSCAVYDFEALRQYYLNLLKQCDIIHCNSQIACDVYQKYLPQANYEIIPITHNGIRWQPIKKSPDSQKIILGFSGPEAAFKGLPMLLDVLSNIKSTNWQLEIWGTEKKQTHGHITYCGKYKNAADAFKKLDLLIVPSIWNETFGFIIPEALSLGIPVLCSDTVGAQSLIDKSMIFHNQDGLKQSLENLLSHPEILADLRNNIIKNSSTITTIQRHAAEIEKLYKS